MRITKNQNGYWEATFRGLDGKQHSRSTGLRLKDDALKVIQECRLKEFEMAARMGVLKHEVASVLMTGDNPVVVEDAIAQWEEHMVYRRLAPKTIRHSVIWLKCWAAWAHAEQKPVSALRIQDFDGWINGGENKLGTRQGMLSCVRSFCKFCQDSGWNAGNPANLIQIDLSILKHSQKETLKRPCFTEEEVQTLIDGTSPGAELANAFWHAAIIISRYTGLRISDVACLEWESIDLSSRTLTVWTVKRDKRVFLPLEPEILLETIQELPQKHPVYVFPSQRNINNDVSARSILSSQFSSLVRDLGLPPGKTFHCLRATYISDCNARGIPIEHISRSVGHSSPVVTRGYIRPTE